VIEGGEFPLIVSTAGKADYHAASSVVQARNPQSTDHLLAKHGQDVQQRP
jgi:hypothetical protein